MVGFVVRCIFEGAIGMTPQARLDLEPLSDIA
jgi:hypothetical protein